MCRAGACTRAYSAGSVYQQAIPLAVRLIEAYAETLDTDTPLDKAYEHTFGEF